MSKEHFSFESQYSEVRKTEAIAPLQTNHTLEHGKAFLDLITRISVEKRAIALSIVNQFEYYDYNDYLTSLDGKRRHKYWHSVRYRQESGETWQFIRQDYKDKRGYVYRAPSKIGNRAFLPAIPSDIRKAIGDRYGLKVPLDGSFWEWFKQNKQIPLEITEGGKSLSGLSHSFVTTAVYGCSCLGSPDLLPYIKGRDIRIALDCDTKPSAIRAVRHALFKHLKPLSKLAKSVKVVTWDSKNKGLDDLLASGGSVAYECAIATAKSADDWLFEQNLEIARQRLEVSDKLTHDIEITHDEFKALTHDTLKAITGNARDIAINAFTGAGKTEKAAKFIAKYLYAIAPFHRKALAKSASGDLGLTYRTDCDRLGKDLITTEGGYVTKLGLCNEAVISLISAINGLLGKGAFAFGDEFDQQLESLALSSTHGKDGRRRLHQRVFADIFKMAVQTLITSADLTDYEINQFHKMTGRKPFVIKVKTVKKGYQTFMYQQFADFWLKFNEAIAQGKRILVLCTRKEDAKFLQFAYGAVAVHADNSGDYQDLLDSPNTWLPKNKPILMAVSPVFGTGFSIKVDAFDCVFGWFKADNIAAKGLIQFLNRYRPHVERHIYCDYSSGRFDGLTPNDLFKTRLAKAKVHHVIEGEASFINSDDPYFHHKAETNWSLAHLRADLFARLERDVETVEYVRSQLSDKARKAVTKELNAKFKGYRATYPIKIYEARNLSLSEYLALKDESNLSEADRLAVAKFEIADWSCLTPEQLTLERVQRDRKGKKRKAVSNLEMQCFPQIAVSLDQASVDKQVKHGEGIAHQDISDHALRVKALDKLGIGEALDYVLSGAVWSNDTSEIVAIAQKLIDNRETLTKIGIRLTCGKNASHNAVFGALLKNYFGLATVRTQKRIGGKVTSFYHLCIDDLALTRTDLIARLQRNIERYGALTPNTHCSFVESIYSCHTPFVNNTYQKVCDSKERNTEQIPDPPNRDEAIAPGLITQPTFITRIMENVENTVNLVADTVINAIAMGYLSSDEIAEGYF